MIIKAYEKLPEEAQYIRQTVFVEEQGFKEEFDTIDNTAVHAVGFADGTPIITSYPLKIPKFTVGENFISDGFFCQKQK